MTKSTPLKEACVLEAIEILREQGLERLSLREVARRLDVSHQAPYKHFSSKDHLLAEVIRRCLRRFAATLEASGPQQSPTEAMRALGQCYLKYAAEFPLEYKLMFMTRWPEAAQAIGLAEDARAAFDCLVRRLAALRPDAGMAELEREALFVWSTIHGLASILQSEAMPYLSFSDAQTQAAVAHAMAQLEAVTLRSG